MTAAAPSALPRRRAHRFGDRVERLFSKGQEALRGHDAEGAVALLRQACELDPGYARIRCWLAQALADAGRMDEAEAAFEHAGALRAARDDLPRRSLGVFPLQRGLAWIDAGEPERARAHLERARELAPQNKLVEAGLALCAWDLGQERRVPVLLADIEHMPARHQARVLVRLARRTHDAGRPASEPSTTPPAPTPLGRWLQAREGRRSERKLAQAERQIARRAWRKALDTLRDIQPLTADQRRRQHKRFAEAARGRVDELQTAFDSAAPQGEARADALFRMARQLREAGEDARAAELSNAWLELFAQLGHPQHLVDDALDALGFVAAQGLQADEPERALSCLAEAFALRAKGTGELHRLRAHALLAQGDERGARHDFEDWLADFPLTPEYALMASAP